MQNFKDIPYIWVLIMILLVKLSMISFLSRNFMMKKLLKYIKFDFN